MENKQSVTVEIPHENSTIKVSFHQSKAIGVPLKNLSSDLETKVHQTQVKLLPYEKAIQEWISASPQNVQAFVENPIKAIEASNVSIPADVLSEIKSISNLLLNTLKK